MLGVTVSASIMFQLQRLPHFVFQL